MPFTLEDILRAARLRYETNEKQIAIAGKMNRSTAAVSRMIKLARENGWVKYTVKVPESIELQSLLRDRLPPTFKEVRVVPGGSGKNVANLGAVGAELLLQAIFDVQRRKQKAHPGEGRIEVRITFSSGETLRRVGEELVALLSGSPEVRARLTSHLYLYPAAVFWDVEIRSYYPATLITSLWTSLRPLLSDRVHALAPMLPKAYYAGNPPLWSDPVRSRQLLADSGADEVLNQAAQADIFVVGIGTGGDPEYLKILEATRLPNASGISDEMGSHAEIAYLPLMDHHGIVNRIVRIPQAALVRAAGNPERWCIGIGGGEIKRSAISEVLAAQAPLLNAIVTCEDVATYVLAQISKPESASPSVPDKPVKHRARSRSSQPASTNTSGRNAKL